MKHTLLALGLFLSNLVYAQITVTPSTPPRGLFMIGYPIQSGDPLLNINSDAALSRLNTQKHFYTTFTEFGDGCFTFNSQSKHVYAGTGKLKALAKGTGIYGLPPVPPLANAVFFNNVAGTILDVPEPVLAPGEYVKITPSINSVLPGDPMVFVLTFKQSVSQRGKLVMYYNFAEDGREIFKPADQANGYDISWGNGALMVPAIRGLSGYYSTGLYPGFGSRILFAGTIDDAIRDPGNSTITGELGSNQGRYGHCIVLNIDSLSSSAEKNLFVSLSPVDAENFMFNKDDDNAYLKAVFLPTDAADIPIAGQQSESNIVLPIYADAHDPNGLYGYPACLQGQSPTTRVSYTAHFENDGQGDAQKILLKTKFNVRLKSIKVERVYIGRVKIYDADIPNTNTGSSNLIELKVSYGSTQLFNKRLKTDAMLPGIATGSLPTIANRGYIVFSANRTDANTATNPTKGNLSVQFNNVPAVMLATKILTRYANCKKSKSKNLYKAGNKQQSSKQTKKK